MAFAKGDRVLLIDPTKTGHEGKHLLTLDGEARKVSGLGIIDTSNLVGLEPGAAYQVGRASFRVIEPAPLDLIHTVRRKAQIITEKDAAQIILRAGVRPGAQVLEAGIGSAALTVALASAVGTEGYVTTYEIRPDFRDWGERNVRHAGLGDRVTVTLADPTEAIPLRDLDAVIMDMPTPWLVVPHARDALRPGGTFVAYSPLVTQMEHTVRALREHGFLDVGAQETMVRRWIVKDEGSRPDFEMLGHTAFLSWGRALPEL